MFDIFYIGKKPGLFPHEKSAESIEHACSQSKTRYCWIVNYLCDYTGWDWLWEPAPWQQGFVHVWPSQHHEFSGTYLAAKNCKSDNYHFHKNIVPIRARQEDFLCLVSDVDFDWTWAPHPLDPPFNYVFGNQWWSANKMATVEFHVPGATEIKYMTQKAMLPINYEHWQTIHECKWDYSWVPDPGDPPYIYLFGNQWYSPQIMPTMKYHAPGATEIKYMNYPRAELLPNPAPWQIPEGIDTWDCSWQPDPGSPPYNYQFGTQHQKTGGPVYIMPGATETKFQPYPRAHKMSRDDCWQVPDGVDTETFDWTWHPDATEPPYIYQFGTQHQRTGGPRYVVPQATETKFVEQIKITTRRTAGKIYVIDHMDGNAANLAKDWPQTAPADVTFVRYFDNYLDTLKRIAKNADNVYDEFIWIVSSICDYSNFDFSWHPEQWQAHMLHVFASNDQKFGDTFFMHVPTFLDRSQTCKLLEWYDCNYVPEISVPRLPLPVIHHTQDSHVTAVQSTEFSGPLALFTVDSTCSHVDATVPLWREQVKTVVPLSKGATSVIVPKVAVPFVKTQIYDYPYIDKSHARQKERPMDIVFLSNNEPNADENWEHLKFCAPGTHKLHRVDKIKGRAQSEKAAASVVTTPWYFRVPAKLKVCENFNWSWQPDRLQQPKNYIFYAKNSVNKLEYGHMAIVALNKALCLGTPGSELDFVMESPHEVLPIYSGEAHYAQTPYLAWRTAFRECVKLKCGLPDIDCEYRLAQWLTLTDELNSNWSRQGAIDAVDFYDNVSGNHSELKQSYEWDWLENYFYTRYQPGE